MTHNFIAYAQSDPPIFTNQCRQVQCHVAGTFPEITNDTTALRAKSQKHATPAQFISFANVFRLLLNRWSNIIY